MRILKKQVLADTQGIRIISLDLLAPEIAQRSLPGQFVVVMATEKGERVPLTIVNKDKDKGSITLILQEVGLTTKLLGKLEAGDSLFALLGPLGHPTKIKKYGRIILVGGGVGIAEILPVACAFKEAGNQLSCIIGAKNKGLLILEEELKKYADAFFATTDDGSYGRKGFTIDVATELLQKGGYDLVYAVGPVPMMQRLAAITQGFRVKTIVSLNALMVDGTGMCGCCRVSVAGEIKFSCVDGPEFYADAVDWQELIQRNRIYLEQERHICKILLQ